MKPQTEADRTLSQAPRFYTVGETAAMLRTSAITVYRAISDGELPAVRVRGRLIVPARVIDDLIDAAVGGGALVDAQDWTSNRAIAADADQRTARSARRAADAAGGAR